MTESDCKKYVLPMLEELSELRDKLKIAEISRDMWRENAIKAGYDPDNGYEDF